MVGCPDWMEGGAHAVPMWAACALAPSSRECPAFVPPCPGPCPCLSRLLPPGAAPLQFLAPAFLPWFAAPLASMPLAMLSLAMSHDRRVHCLVSPPSYPRRIACLLHFNQANPSTLPSFSRLRRWICALVQSRWP